MTTAPTRAAVGRFDMVVLDCPDPSSLAQFYADLLGREVADDGDDSWQSLAPDGSAVTLAFQRVNNYVAPGWPDGSPQQIHLDLTVDDFVTAHARTLALGATALSPTSPPEPDDITGFRVYADPAGHPFCLCR